MLQFKIYTYRDLELIPPKGEAIGRRRYSKSYNNISIRNYKKDVEKQYTLNFKNIFNNVGINCLLKSLFNEQIYRRPNKTIIVRDSFAHLNDFSRTHYTVLNQFKSNYSFFIVRGSSPADLINFLLQYNQAVRLVDKTYDYIIDKGFIWRCKPGPTLLIGYLLADTNVLNWTIKKVGVTDNIWYRTIDKTYNFNITIKEELEQGIMQKEIQDYCLQEVIMEAPFTFYPNTTKDLKLKDKRLINTINDYLEKHYNKKPGTAGLKEIFLNTEPLKKSLFKKNNVELHALLLETSVNNIIRMHPHIAKLDEEVENQNVDFI